MKKLVYGSSVISLLLSLTLGIYIYHQIFSSLTKSDQIILVPTGTSFSELKDNIKDILNPYFTTKKNGTGLGLSIVNKIVNDHNGKIDFIPIKNGAKINIIFLK